MTTIQEQYSELIKQSQDASRVAIETWTQTFQQAAGQLSGSGLISPNQVIDQVFDFAGQVLNAQRDFAKQLVATSTAMAEKARDGVSQAPEHATRADSATRRGPVAAGPRALPANETRETAMALTLPGWRRLESRMPRRTRNRRCRGGTSCPSARSGPGWPG